MTERMSDAVNDAIHHNADGELVTRWVAVVEVIDARGKRARYTLSPEGSCEWDSEALLGWAYRQEQADMLRRELRRHPGHGQ